MYSPIKKYIHVKKYYLIDFEKIVLACRFWKIKNANR